MGGPISPCPNLLTSSICVCIGSTGGIKQRTRVYMWNNGAPRASFTSLSSWIMRGFSGWLLPRSPGGGGLNRISTQTPTISYIGCVVDVVVE